ncbi:MAG: hypothetical protein J0H74_15550 [Chitinophagaceae bacterium]|nr:hypothetical protein [Chitinophagaceae bacterium]
MQDHLSEYKDGLGQSDRLLHMLLPDSVSIDARDPAAFIQRAVRLAEQFNYYNTDNHIEGDWKDFFLSDINILTLFVAGWDLSTHSRAYETLLSDIRLTTSGDDTLPDKYREFTDTIAGLTESLTSLLQRVEKMNIPSHIRGKIDEIMQKVVAIRPQLRTQEPLSPQSITTLHKVFSDILIQCSRLQEITTYFSQHNEWLTRQYTPHLGLFLTFLRLYSYLQEEINQLTKKHLVLYFRDVLGIAAAGEIPDKVHLLFALNNNTGYTRLSAKEEMLAEIPGREEPLRYRLTEDAVVTKTGTSALRTLFVSNSAVFPDDDTGDSPVTNAQVYQADILCPSPGDLLKGATPIPWALFGEDQDELSSSGRSMKDTDIGLLLASPIFYLTEGHRKINLTFYLEPSSFKALSDYIGKFAAASLKTALSVENEILTRAFNIDFTAADGWSPVERHTTRMRADNVLEVLIELGADVKPLAVYKPGIHGPDNDTAFPAFRLLINNDAPHNAFSFLRGLQIQRIHLKTQVQNFRQVRMQNSIGNLAVASAFQPFGPQPAVGSYLDIKNSNVFNHYTTGLSVRLEWMDLPKEPGGFTTWFAGYNAGITDESFRVGIGSLTSGVVQPTVTQQQTFSLYARNTDDGSNGPASVTWIRDIDIKKLTLSNKPLLAREEEESNGFFRNGAIRLELLSPPEAFGHTLFPRIFPEIAMHNARLWNRKLPLPNQPYTPKAKSVSINYTLEHAEAFRDIQDIGGSGEGLHLIHQYPFGYKKIYPGGDARAISLLPDFGTGGHLHIGLNDVTAGEELSLLFQLEEKNFHHTFHDAGDIVWSYLVDNDWVTMGPDSILSDATHRFISTGIIRLKMPSIISLQHTILPNGLFWIRVSAGEATDLRTKVISIFPHAGLAERVPDQEQLLQDRGFVLPSGTIKTFVRKIQELDQVWQPFPSFGGTPAEKDVAYYTRISERLRHKQRPLTSLDIEQLVLEQFPSIAVVKCFGTTYRRPSVYPGVDIQVILIPKEIADGSSYTDQPRADLATLFAVKNYLAGFTSPFINIEIGNPVYEKVKIACRIRLKDRIVADAGSGYYLQQLHEDIRGWLCPWIYSPDSTVKIGTRIYIPELMTYIKRRPYIEEVSGFSVVHFFNIKDPVTGALKSALLDTAVTPVPYIQGSVPEAVLVPSEQHLISLQTNDDYIEPSPKGIGDFQVGDELLIYRSGYHKEEGYDEAPVSWTSPEEYFNLTFVNPINK